MEPPLEGVVVHRHERAEGARVRIVHQDVEAPEGVHHLLHHARDGYGVRHVAGEWLSLDPKLAQLVARVVQLGRRAADDSHLHALPAQRQCDALSDALSGAGDQRDLVLECSHGVHSSVSVGRAWSQ